MHRRIIKTDLAYAKRRQTGAFLLALRIMITVFLFLLGLIFGSFLNATAYRLNKRQSLTAGRSRCESCGHLLNALDLFPVVSWVGLRGKCRYCGKPISWQHPVVELATGLAFAASYIWWPASLNLPGQHLLFAGWLICLIGLLALAIYDLRFMILPSKIVYPTFLVAAIFRLNHILAYDFDKKHAFINWLAAVAIASGFFWLLFNISRGRWIGYGDVRLGLITGTWLADPALALLMIFIASLLGSIVSIGLIIGGRKRLNSKIPFGPYLIAGTFITLLFGQGIIDWYNRVFLG